MSTLKTDNISPNGSTVNVTSGLNVQGGATLAAATITGNLNVDGNVFGVNATTNTVTVSSPANTTPVLLLGVSANAGTTHRSIFRFGHDQNSSSIPVGEIHGVVDNVAGASQRAGHIEFITANAGVTAERMRITSNGNVGIGTSSPTQGLLQVTTSSGQQGQIAISSTDYGGLTVLGHDMNGDCFIYETAASKNIRLGTSNTERMRITSTGNVGIGNNALASTIPGVLTVTDSTNTTKAAFGTNAANSLNFIQGGGDYMAIGYNLLHTGTNNTWNYVGADKASLLRWHNGGFQFWGTSTQGSAGAAASLTNILTIGSDGKLTIPGGINLTGNFSTNNYPSGTLIAVKRVSLTPVFDSRVFTLSHTETTVTVSLQVQYTPLRSGSTILICGGDFAANATTGGNPAVRSVSFTAEISSGTPGGTESVTATPQSYNPAYPGILSRSINAAADAGPIGGFFNYTHTGGDNTARTYKFTASSFIASNGNGTITASLDLANAFIYEIAP